MTTVSSGTTHAFRIPDDPTRLGSVCLFLEDTAGFPDAERVLSNASPSCFKGGDILVAGHPGAWLVSLSLLRDDGRLMVSPRFDGFRFGITTVSGRFWTEKKRQEAVSAVLRLLSVAEVFEALTERRRSCRSK